MTEWIKIRKDIIRWKYWSRPELPMLLIYLITSANTKDVEEHGRRVRMGQLITTRRQIAEDNPKLSDQMVRTCLARLKESGLIEIETCKDYTLITICHYEDYRVDSTEDTEGVFELKPEEPVKKSQAVKRREEMEEKMNVRKEKFYDSLIPYLSKYSREMLRDFYNYWSEPNKSKSKMRFEMEVTWELGRRLGTWNRNQERYGKREQAKQERERRAADHLQQIIASNKQATADAGGLFDGI